MAAPDATEPEPPRLRFRDMTAGGSGALLLLMLASLTLQLALSPGEGAHVVTIIVQAAIIVLAVHVWDPHQLAGRIVLAAVGLVLVATVASAAAKFTPTSPITSTSAS